MFLIAILVSPQYSRYSRMAEVCLNRVFVRWLKSVAKKEGADKSWRTKLFRQVAS
jgi:hypothetical protein